MEQVLQPVTEAPQSQGSTAIRADFLTRWQPGKSGNPGGMPKGIERPDVLYARLLTLPLEQFETYKPRTPGEELAYARICEARETKTRYALPSHQEVFDRAFGKPIARTESTVVTTNISIELRARDIASRYNVPVEQVMRDLLGTELEPEP